jgi:hypothetical protein
VSGQSLPIDDPFSSYLRVLQLGGFGEAASFTVLPLSLASAIRPFASDTHPWSDQLGTVHREDPRPAFWSVGGSRIRVFANTGHPVGQNDGAVWQGKGLTTALETTVRLGWRGLSVTLNPLFIRNQNAGFDLAPVTASELPEFAYPWHRIDYPQRFGPEDYWTFDLGQSQVAVDWSAARFSVGNENLWWGPAVQNAIVMSNNAPGFLHASLATNRPVDVGIGEIEGQWVWGGLGQSEWFDPALADTDRFLTGLVLSYSPSVLEGLTVGFTRVFQQLVPDGGLDAAEYLLAFQGLVKTGQVSSDDPDGTDDRDQLLSLFGRWAFPEVGFEVYFEWARNDHAWDFNDLLLEPEHSQAYTLGFQKVTSFSTDRALVLRGELTHLEAPPTFQVRPRGVYYTHSVVTQGYTHKGQILGAGIGPGGNAQSIGLETFETWGSAGLFVQRRVHDNDAYWLWAEQNDATFDKHDVSFDFGADGMYFLGGFEFGGGLIYTRELNRYFFGPKVNNLNLQLEARWRPGLR